MMERVNIVCEHLCKSFKVVFPRPVYLANIHTGLHVTNSLLASAFALPRVPFHSTYGKRLSMLKSFVRLSSANELWERNSNSQLGQ